MNERNDEALSEAQEFARIRMRRGEICPAGYSAWADAMEAARLALPGGAIWFLYEVAFAICRSSRSFVGDQTPYMDLGEDWTGHTSPTAQQVECPTDDLLSAQCYLRRAEAEMQDRASSRDAPDGERSMGRAVAAFNSLYGAAIRARVQKGLAPLDETMGWQFMSVLKKSRGAGGAYREDDYTDDVAYAALAAESAAKENEQ